MLSNGSQQAVAVRVFQWIAGDTLSNYLSSSGSASLADTSLALFEQLGNALGLMYHALKDLDHPSFHRNHLWDLAQFPNVASLITYTQDDRELYDHIVSLQSIYQIMTEAMADKLPKSLIMGDANDANVIVKDNQVAGLIDFSDAIVTWSINELAIAMAYGLVSASHSGSYLEVVSSIFSGYVKHRVLNEHELLILPMLMATRLATSIMVGAYSISKEPENEYLKLHALPARKSLKFWMTTDRGGADVAFQQHSIYFQKLQDSVTATKN
jgi:Ser/Thr protein kinase RdoA (MazF antagonist)